jgi:glycosyltransferase involved in cell wall biosynthesis
MKDAGRIIHVPRRFTESDWGGTETVLAELLRRQRQRGGRPEIHTSLALSRTRRETWRGIEVRRYPYCYPFFGLTADQRQRMDKKGGNLLSFRLFFGLCLRGEVRLFHAHALKRLGGEVLSAARLRRKPFVVTLHGGVFDVPAEELGQLLSAQAGKIEWGRGFGALFQSHRVLRAADAVICVGRTEYERVRTEVGHDRVHYLGNGVDAQRFSAGDGARFRAAHGIPPEARVLACISRYDPQKDQRLLLEAFDVLAAQHPDLHLVLAGPSTITDYVVGLDARIAASPQARRIRRLGALNPATSEVADALAATDIFVLPSRHEPFGIVVLEAWSAGRPVVVAEVGGLRHLVRDGENGLFFPSGLVAPCVARLDELLRDPARRAALGAAGRQLAVESYSWEKFTEMTEHIYQQAKVRAGTRR